MKIYFFILFMMTAIFYVTHEKNAIGEVVYTTVAILGDSRSNGKDGTEGINDKVLSKLFSMIRIKKPQALIFSGDLTLGLEEEEVAEELYESHKKNREKSEKKDHWVRNGFVYNDKAYMESLNYFTQLQKKYLGLGIPVYPVIGNHEAVGPDAVNIFRKHFNIKNVAPTDNIHLAYTVEVGKSLFIILATDYYNRLKNKLVEHNFSQDQKQWLENTLREKAKRFSSVYVVGHEPAFSVLGQKKNHPVGLDCYPVVRNEFWAILKKYGVKAYICSHEHLCYIHKYDGVWQIISGGAGAPLAPLSAGGYYHYAMLEIPVKKNMPPRLIITDTNGIIKQNIILK